MQIRCIAFILTLSLAVACGGGGGGSEENLGTEACGALGLPVKIINGTECANLTNSPVVRVVLIDSAGRESYCSGTVVTSSKVLTAGHCFRNRPVRVFVRYGDTLASSTPVRAESWHRHPQLSGSEGFLFNDIAVIELNKALPLPTVPIAASSFVRAGDVVSIFGYGVDENNDFKFDDLRSGQMRVSEVTANHILAVFGGEGSNTCLGDSGGPMLEIRSGREVLVGVTSTGTETECGPGDNSLFTKVSSESVLAFLEEQIPEAEFIE